MRRVLVLFGVAVLALGVTAAPAAATKKKKQKVKPFAVTTATASATSVTSGTELSATATCPAGTTAVGGGFETLSGQHVFLAVESMRVGTNAWRVRGVSVLFAPGVSQSVNVEAYCAKLRGTVSEASAESALGGMSGDAATVTSSCSTGSRLLSGGFTGPLITDPDASLAVPRDSKPVGEGWLVRMSRFTDGAPPPASPIRSISYCFTPPKKAKKKQKMGNARAFVSKKRKKKKKAPGPKPLTILTGSGAQGTTLLSRVSVVTPACPKGRTAISGGFEIPQAPNTGLPVIETTHLSGGAWTIATAQFGGGATLAAPLTAYEGCA